MALVQTRQIPKDGKFTSVAQVIRALRGAVADEMSAQNLYAEIIDCLGPGNSLVTDKLKEIMNDEIQHAGKLIACITELDNSIAVEMQKGAEGA